MCAVTVHVGGLPLLERRLKQASVTEEHSVSFSSVFVIIVFNLTNSFENENR